MPELNLPSNDSMNGMGVGAGVAVGVAVGGT